MSQGETEGRLGPVGAPTGRLLFGLVGGWVAWTLHFLGGYAVVAIGCVGGWSAIRAVLAAGTVLLAGVALWSSAVAWQDWRRVSAGQPWDEALSEPRGWFGFLMLAGMLLGALSAATILLEGFATLALPVCGWDVR
jgi:hypothetical protein